MNDGVGEARSRSRTGWTSTGPAARSFSSAGWAACPVVRSTRLRARATLQDRYPLPDWAVDSPCKYGLTLTVANAIGQEVEHWPGFAGPTAALGDHARRITRAVLDTLNPGLAWLTWLTGITDGVSYPGDELVSYISQLALTRPDETPDPEQYRELLRYFSWYLFQQAERFERARGRERSDEGVDGVPAR